MGYICLDDNLEIGKKSNSFAVWSNLLHGRRPNIINIILLQQHYN